MNSRYFRAAGVFLLLAALHLLVYAQMPAARRDNGWPTIVMHNWHENGYWRLGGQLVTNPGGLDAGEAKDIYPGHRPTFLIIPYLLKELPGAAAGDGLLYDFTVLALTYAALLWLLGAGLRGVLIAVAVCLAPAFINNLVDVDTIGVPAMLGIAAMSFAGGCLARSETGLPLRLAALAVLALFMLLNWSTLFPLGIAAVYVCCKRPDWKKCLGYFAVALAIGLGVLAVSMHSKHSTGMHSGDFWNSYLWGPLGYDRAGMTFSKAFVRITAVNLVGWLPVLIAGVALLLTNGRGSDWRRAPWPLLAGIAAVFTLRNYTAHHPWTAVCEVGLGLVFSLELLTGENPVATRWFRNVTLGMVGLFLLGYLGFWLALDEFNGRGEHALKTLVAQHTPRHALLVVAPDLLPAGLKDWQPMAETFDRKAVAPDDWNRHLSEFATRDREVYLLTHATPAPAGAKLIAQSQTRATWADKILVPLFDFYRNKISRRAPGNRKEYFDEYRLYQLRPQN